MTPEQEAAFPLIDTQLADYAVHVLRELAATGDRFFLGLGFRRPHIPFAFPERSLRHYLSKKEGEEEETTLPSSPYAPVDMPLIAWRNFSDWSQYGDTFLFEQVGDVNFTFPDDFARDLRRAYYASVTHVDEELGRVLRLLREVGLDRNTVVSFIGTLGYFVDSRIW